MRSMVGSLAKLRKRVTRSRAPFSSKSCLKKRAVSKLTPIAAKTIEKLSSWSSCTPLVGLTRPACLQIWAAIYEAGQLIRPVGSIQQKNTHVVVR